MPTIYIREISSPNTSPTAQATAKDYLDGREFDTLYKTCRAASFRSRGEGLFLGAVQAVPVLVEALQRAGFSVSVSPGVKYELNRSNKLLLAPSPDKLLKELKARGLTLFPHQVEGIRWMRNRTSGILGDEPGLGKTCQALLALPEEKVPVIIVCPAAVRKTWEREVRLWRPDYSPTIESKLRPARPGEVLILSYNALSELYEYPSPRTVLIADEAHYLKSSGTQRTKHFRALYRAVYRTEGRVFGLTGTPLSDRPKDLWNTLHNSGNLAEAAFGNVPAFARMMGGFQGRFCWEYDLSKVLPMAKTCLEKVMLRRLKADVLPELEAKRLPPKRLYCPLPDAVRKQADKVWNDVRASGLSIEEIDKLMSTNHPKFTELSKLRRTLAQAKVPFLLEYLKELDEPCIVFSDHRDPLLALEKKGWPLVIGGQTPTARDKIIQDFQAGKGLHLGVSITAGGIGITLTRAAHAVFLDLSWTPGNNLQAADRLVRIGQNAKHVSFIHIVADHPIDERVHEVNELKLRLIKKVTR